MEKIIIVAHGSYKKETNNNLKDFTKAMAVKLKINPEDIKYAYLRFKRPTVEEAISQCISENAKTIIIHPLFLSSGTHVTLEIPKIIESFKQKHQEIEIVYTKPLGLHEKLIDIVKERIEEIKQLKTK